MKSVKLIFVIVLLAALGTVVSAQTAVKASTKQKTETLKVWGKCDMCKSRIEKAVREEGATTASWDSKTRLLTVSYDPSKTNSDAFGKKLAAIGHDTDKYKATDEAYENLPGCCHYERSK
jgi:periplasmic mercuric ion binding protein